MNLIEIVKGMPNASEAINENFQNGSIVEYEIGETEGFIKYGNGFMLCFAKIIISDVGANGSGTASSPYRSSVVPWNFPRNFVEDPFVWVTNNISARLGSGRRAITISAVTTNVSQAEFQGISPFSDKLPADQQETTANVYAVGIYK